MAGIATKCAISSHRGKLKHRVLRASPNIGDTTRPRRWLVSDKLSTHLDEHVVARLDPNGDPLWFTLGKGSEDLILTGKKPDLLLVLTTPAAVIPVLVGGADLMIPGGESASNHFRASSPLQPRPILTRQIASQSSNSGQKRTAARWPARRGRVVPPRSGAPLAVGRMALSAEDVRARGERENEKGRGKAVLVLHTWKDCLWEMGAGGDVPAPQNVGEAAESEQQQGEEHVGAQVGGADGERQRQAEWLRRWHSSRHYHPKGALKPISVAAKIRQGKTSTLISGFEPFLGRARRGASAALRVRDFRCVSHLHISS
ncbi:hypothetical protein FIBSPDRAFT_963615 [Athelia psychrophila]|uniref:Uncharacterized protein n=1 Tax=Athelia psychrophila TaxID=1759441 RepID=A0A165YRT4_9AGAM|nr:hypothetical protein FIBSPDRAFT_966959 [Fibularhizoctonia sp. CBS 109695]KZP09849.1 hypothetical protein FIBSPDRAFT_963615 [Fibularhizoctonia sp. CBS 109695]